MQADHGVLKLFVLYNKGCYQLEKTMSEKKKLSEAEVKRLERFEIISDDLKQQGYRRQDLTVSIGAANVFSVVLVLVLFVIAYGLYYLVNHTLDFPGADMVFYLIGVIVLVVVHELVHGLTWSFFTPHGFKDIEFGIMKPSMTPYCTCLVPLKKEQHMIGTVMPLIVLGIIPMIIAILTANPGLLFISVIMSASAAGDIMILHRMLGYKTNAKEIIYMDHPTEAGGVVFEK